jgi:hypothetical protein
VNRLQIRLGRASPLIIVLIIVMIFAVLCVGVYLGDRYAQHRAEHRVATALGPHLGTPEPPQVDIEGFPFLTQVMVGSVGKIHIVADQLGVSNNAPVILVHADLVMTDVATNDWFKTMKITHTEGTALLDYTKLSALAGAPLTYGSEGRVQIVHKTTVLGREVDAVITGAPRLDVDEQTMTLSDAKISVAGVNLPDFTAQALLAALLKPIPLKGMPIGLTVMSIEAAGDGLHLALTGDSQTISS